MNWLAHIYLSDGSDENMLGNLLGDFIVRVRWKEIYSPQIQRGIRMHFAVDTFTDTHRVFQKSCSRISKKYSRFSGVLIDVFYDHYLAKYWSDFSDRDLESFTNDFYRVLEKYKDILPHKLAYITPYMSSTNWLLSYREIGSIEIVLERLTKRLRGSGSISGAIVELTGNYRELEEDFRDFFPEVKKFAADYLTSHPLEEEHDGERKKK